MSKIIYNSSKSHFEIRSSRYKISVSGAIIKVANVEIFYYYKYKNESAFKRDLSMICDLLVENKVLLNMLFDFEKAEGFEFVYTNNLQPTFSDIAGVLCGTFGNNEYYSTLNLAQIDFSKAKGFVSEILDFYSENYE